jgi:hypothetical protein
LLEIEIEIEAAFARIGPVGDGPVPNSEHPHDPLLLDQLIDDPVGTGAE